MGGVFALANSPVGRGVTEADSRLLDRGRGDEAGVTNLSDGAGNLGGVPFGG